MPVVLRTRGGGEWLIKFTIQQFQNARVDKLWLYGNTANIFSSPFKDIKAGHFVLLQDQYCKDFFEDVFVDNFYLGGFLKQRYHVLCSLVLVEIVSAKVPKNKQTNKRWNNAVGKNSVGFSFPMSLKVLMHPRGLPWLYNTAPEMRGVLTGDIFKTK